jgi:hypothetical protein
MPSHVRTKLLPDAGKTEGRLLHLGLAEALLPKALRLVLLAGPLLTEALRLVLLAEALLAEALRLVLLLLILLHLADVLLYHLLGRLLGLLEYTRLHQLLKHLLRHLLDDRVLGQCLYGWVRLRLLLDVLKLLDLLRHRRLLLADQLDDLLPNELLGNPVGKLLEYGLLLLDLLGATDPLQPERATTVSPAALRLLLVPGR